MTDLWDGRTNHTGWNYNEYGRLVSKVDALDYEVLRYNRDANGQVTSRWTRQFGDTTYVRDANGNVTSIQYPGSSISFAYDRLNRLQSMTSPAGTFGYDYTVGQSVSPAPLVRGITLPNSASLINHYDSLSRLDSTALVNKWGHVLDGYSYGMDLLGLRTNIVRDLGLTSSSVSIGYDNAEQITSWSARESNGTLRLNEQYTYVWDKAGNLRLLGKGNLTETFGCDSLNQITNITRSGTLTVSGVTPVPAVSVTINGQLAQTNGDFTFACTNFTLTNGQNTFTIIAQSASGLRNTNTEICNLPSAISLTWDSNGNLTSDGTRFFAYNPENRLLTNWVASAWKTEFVYDGLGRRRIARDYSWSSAIRDWQLTNETHYVYDGWLLVQERDSNNAIRVTYTRGLDFSSTLAGAGGIGGLLARTDVDGSTFYHADGAGNITGLMDGQGNMAARYMFGPFGRLVGKWGPMADVNEMLFSSMPTHPLSGLSLYPFRAYDPNLQRWLSQDPIGEMGGVNLYGFVRNNPMSTIDPDGLDSLVAGVDGSYNNSVPALTLTGTMGGPITTSYPGMDSLFAIGAITMGGMAVGGVVENSPSILLVAAATVLDQLFPTPLPAETEIGVVPSWLGGPKASGMRCNPVKKTLWTPTERNRAWKAKGRPEGKAPQREVIVRSRKTGELETRVETKELHHKDPRRAGGDNKDSNLQDVWPSEHEQVDPHRRLGYDTITEIPEDAFEW